MYNMATYDYLYRTTLIWYLRIYENILAKLLLSKVTEAEMPHFCKNALFFIIFLIIDL